MRYIQPPPTPLPSSYADVAKHNQIQTDETTTTIAQHPTTLPTKHHGPQPTNNACHSIKMKDKFIRIAQWNANGLMRHQEKLKIFLKMNAINIILVKLNSLTKATASSLSINYIKQRTAPPMEEQPF
jgi:hypothetical protein